MGELTKFSVRVILNFLPAASSQLTSRWIPEIPQFDHLRLSGFFQSSRDHYRLYLVMLGTIVFGSFCGHNLYIELLWAKDHLLPRLFLHVLLAFINLFF